MSVLTRHISIRTEGFGQVSDLTAFIRNELAISGLTAGTVLIFVPGSTAGVTTIEFESGVIEDFRESTERLIPESGHYEHNARWGDGNGFSHVRAAWIGPSLTVPFENCSLLLGTWQQVVLVDFDNRSRQREIIVQMSGE
ncbi:YjbQ family protein [bacterium]|nr:YjbQ family protein [candidate division CSSED10-310 bacterium]